MIDHILSWIQKKLGRVMDMPPEEFAACAADGYIICEILHAHEIINDVQLKWIIRSTDPEVCKQNFKVHIQHWLKKINISLTNDEIDKICHAHTTNVFNVLHQMFLEMQNKGGLRYITDSRKLERLQNRSGKFKVTRVVEKELPVFLPYKNIYCYPLVSERNVVHWYKDKLKVLMQEFRQNRAEFCDIVNLRQTSYMKCSRLVMEQTDSVQCQSDSPELDQLTLNQLNENKTYCDLMKQKKAAQSMAPLEPDFREAHKIVAVLKGKQRLRDEREIFKKQLHEELVNAIWEKLYKNGVWKFEEVLAEKLLRTSLYEKDLISKLVEAKMQKNAILENHSLMEDHLKEEKKNEFLRNLIMRNNNIQEEKLKYYLEKERLRELHDKIFQEKIRILKQRHYNQCLEAINDVVNIALRHCEYKEAYGEEPPRRVKEKWNALFAEEQPIFDVVLPVQDIVQKPKEDLPETIEELISTEIERQEKLDMRDFLNYMEFKWPWTLNEEVWNESKLNDVKCGINVLGYIVHKLLLKKYPIQQKYDPPKFEDLKIAACVDGFIDTSYLETLQQLLNYREVKVIQMEDAINYCIAAFKEEVTVEYDDTLLIDETEDTLKYEGKSQKLKDRAKSKPKKGEKKGKKLKIKDFGVNKAEESIPKELQDKIIQTPKLFPSEELVLSNKAELGKIADRELSLGRPLTDYLLIKMLMEYLKSIPKLKGWVILNYPKNYQQAVLLEEELTGKMVIDSVDVHSLFCRSILSYCETEVRKKPDEVDKSSSTNSRHSKILPNTLKQKKLQTIYNCFLTAFIRLKQIDEADDVSSISSDLPPIHDPLKVSKNPLDRFYSEMGCNYSVYYETFDFSTIKYLAKLIIGDFSLPPKASLELFGDTINYLEAGDPFAIDKTKSKRVGEGKKIRVKKFKTPKPADKGDEVKKNKKEKKAIKNQKRESKDKKPKKSKKESVTSKTDEEALQNRVIIVHEDKYVQVPEVEEIVEESEEAAPLVAPSPGQDKWDYVDLDFPEELQIALATLWEGTEEVYIQDMQQLFFIRRTILDAVIPYVNYINKHMQFYLSRPDDMQSCLTQFQRIYNDFDEDFRSAPEFKAEIHHRISELEEKLEYICHTRMLEAENERRSLIDSNWVINQLAELGNYCIGAFELELSRHIDSMQLITDYYSAIVTKMPNSFSIDKISLKKIDCAALIKDQVALMSVNQQLEDRDASVSSTAVQIMVSHQYEKALSFVDGLKRQCLEMATKIQSVFQPKSRKGSKDKDTTKRRDTKSNKSKSSKNENEYVVNLANIFEPEQIVKNNYDKIVEEWTSVLDGEKKRVILRLCLIQTETFARIEEVLFYAQKYFHQVFDNIKSKYENESNGVKTALEILRRATEEETPIQEELILSGERFAVNENVAMYEDEVPIQRFEPPEETVDTEGVFTIEQLDYLSTILRDLAPSGYIPERTFIFILQDLIVQNNEGGRLTLPKLWRQLRPEGVAKLSKLLFDNLEYIYWRDFILINLMIPFPNESELLDLRKEFRLIDPDVTELVSDYQFTTMKFWFENRPIIQNSDRNKLIKSLLFKLYKVKNGNLNYTAFLLDMAKDENPIVGFAKAMEVVLGRRICWDAEIGDNYTKTIMDRRHEHEIKKAKREQEYKEHYEVAEQVVLQLIDTTVHLCDSLLFEDELNKEAPTIEDKIEKYLKEGINEKENEEEGTYFGKHFDQLAEKSFSNVAVDFEASAGPPLVYIVPLEVVLMTLAATMPWHLKVENITDKSIKEIFQQIYEDCRNPLFNNEVCIHEFLNNETICDIMYSTKKFLSQNAVHVVENIVSKECQW